MIKAFATLFYMASLFFAFGAGVDSTRTEHNPTGFIGCIILSIITIIMFCC